MPKGVYVRTKEYRLRVSLSVKGRKPSLETKAKMSKAHKGNKYALGHHHTEEWKRHNSIIQKGIIHKSPTMETRNKLRDCNIGKILSSETKLKIGKASREHWMNKDYRDRTIKGLKKNWLNPIYKENWLRKTLFSLNIKPNKPETFLMKLLAETCPNEWTFVGDGKLFIGGKNPDFANIHGTKQVIELFGDYWHGERARCYEETEKGRIELFKQYGYDTLIIWEKELKNPQEVISKIISFSSK